MASRFVMRRGSSTNIPTLLEGELGLCTDERTVFVGTSSGNRQIITRVKGNNEVSYRDGDVNITKANIGLGNVDNTADATKSVLHAVTADSATSATTATTADSATTSGSCSGNSATATKLKTARNIALSGNASGSASFDGSKNISISVTVSKIGSGTVGSANRPIFLSSGTPTACTQVSSGSYKSAVPFIDNSGLMDVGSEIDFHAATGTTTAGRMYLSGTALYYTGDFHANKVYSYVWNDYADALPRDTLQMITYGDIIAKDINSNIYTLANKKNRRLVVGVYSDTCGSILGYDPNLNETENEEKYLSVAMSGNVRVKIDGKIKAGDLITVSGTPGIGKRANRYFHKPGTIIGKALESKNTNGIDRVLMQCMLM